MALIWNGFRVQNFRCIGGVTRTDQFWWRRGELVTTTEGAPTADSNKYMLPLQLALEDDDFTASGAVAVAPRSLWAVPMSSDDDIAPSWLDDAQGVQPPPPVLLRLVAPAPAGDDDLPIGLDDDAGAAPPSGARRAVPIAPTGDEEASPSGLEDDVASASPVPTPRLVLVPNTADDELPIGLEDDDVQAPPQARAASFIVGVQADEEASPSGLDDDDAPAVISPPLLRLVPVAPAPPDEDAQPTGLEDDAGAAPPPSRATLAAAPAPSSDEELPRPTPPPPPTPAGEPRRVTRRVTVWPVDDDRVEEIAPGIFVDREYLDDFLVEEASAPAPGVVAYAADGRATATAPALGVDRADDDFTVDVDAPTLDVAVAVKPAKPKR